ncbi:SCO4225 family membrane protein [Streptomyces sp. NPDC127197]|uniref:SCO4225 family membrane protein n=1 Tax=Streptomyces sp. NPDC127197 TaxID=3345388 RepID=UPI0036433F48
MHWPRRSAALYTRGDTALIVAGGYAALVVGVAAWLEALVLLGDPGLGGVWLILVTLPVSIPLILIPAPPEAYGVMLAAGGLAQAWVLWRLLRGRRVR